MKGNIKSQIDRSTERQEFQLNPTLFSQTQNIDLP